MNSERIADKETFVRHLEMIQDVINRLATSSFLIRGWSMTVLTTTLLVSNTEKNIASIHWVIPVIFIVIQLGLWILDSVLVLRSRCFKNLYKDVVREKIIDFSMDISTQKGKNGCTIWEIFWGKKLLWLYWLQIIPALIAFFILKCCY